MRVLILNYEFPPLGGGAGNANFYILKEFSKIPGLYIDLITSSLNKFQIQDRFYNNPNIHIHFLDINKKGNLHYQSNKELLLFSWKAFKYAKRLIKKEPFDIVHAFFGIPCGFIARQLGIPYIVSLRGSDVPFYNQRFKYFDKFIFKNLSIKIWKSAKAVVANSTGLKELALKTLPEQKISIIYNGIDTDDFCPIEKNIVTQKIQLISTGRLIERKGFEYLLIALEGLDEFKLILVGDGNLKDSLMQLSSKLNLDVEFTGRVEHKDIKDYLRCADIFVLPSLNEGMSNSVLEAMACGLPLILTDVGGSRELINGNGFIVEKANPAAIREVLLEYSKNRELIKAHGNKSVELAQQYNWKFIAYQYLKLYGYEAQ